MTFYLIFCNVFPILPFLASWSSLPLASEDTSCCSHILEHDPISPSWRPCFPNKLCRLISNIPFSTLGIIVGNIKISEIVEKSFGRLSKGHEQRH